MAQVTYVKAVTITRTVEAKHRWLGDQTARDYTLYEKEVFRTKLYGREWCELTINPTKPDGTMSFFARTDDGTEAWLDIPADAIAVEYGQRTDED